MELGVFLLAGQFPGMTQAHALGGAVDYALAAERAGLTSAWVAEHHFISYGVCPSALALAANLLGRSHRLEVGTAVCMLANRHPVALAEETALLDHLSGGRFHLGVGRGGPWVDLEVFGTGLDRYQHGLAESLDLLLACRDPYFNTTRYRSQSPSPCTVAFTPPQLDPGSASARGEEVTLSGEPDGTYRREQPRSP